ncbi:FAD-binding protein [Flavobacteriaceae bacterium R38]|nr:FAD-binding protein [Flavobacteriaceae bacterium R38]
MDIKNFKKELKANGVDFIWPDNADYDKSRQICNSRFNYKPMVIAYCNSEKDVANCIKLCRKYNIKFRVRSGGHHHEGMCSGDDIMMINLSKMDSIVYVGDDKMKAWIQPGKPLGEVYKELENNNRIIPGGGCATVCVGGLTQGGGWGPSLRKLGLTCDNVEEIQLVDANGAIIKANEKENSDLFWAIRGGGGGNFGVVTNFLFKLTSIETPLHILSVSFPKTLMPKALEIYIDLLPKLHHDITSFGRLTVVNDIDDEKAFYVWAQSYGSEEDLKKAFKPLLDLKKSSPQVLKTNHHEAHQLFNGIIPDTLKNNTVIKPEQFLYQPGNLHESIETCSTTPHPHKVTSCFPKEANYKRLFEIIVKRFLKDRELSNEVITYLSIHSMGGVLKEKLVASAFPFRTKEFMLQFQAWWKNPKDSQQEEYIKWIESFREEISEYTEGAFINFPDKNLVKDPEKQRVELMEYYYKQNLPRLREIKTAHDPENLFYFGMSIPLLNA